MKVNADLITVKKKEQTWKISSTDLEQNVTKMQVLEKLDHVATRYMEEETMASFFLRTCGNIYITYGILVTVYFKEQYWKIHNCFVSTTSVPDISCFVHRNSIWPVNTYPIMLSASCSELPHISHLPTFKLNTLSKYSRRLKKFVR